MKNPKDKLLFEKLAEIEHQRWSDWQKWVHSKLLPNERGELIIPTIFVERWNRQINTPYDKLSEAEKEKDREQVRRYWGLIEITQKEAYERAIKNYG